MFWVSGDIRFPPASARAVAGNVASRDRSNNQTGEPEVSASLILTFSAAGAAGAAVDALDAGQQVLQALPLEQHGAALSPQW